MSSKSRSRSLSSGPKVGSGNSGVGTLSGPIHEVHETDLQRNESGDSAVLGGKESLQWDAGQQQQKALRGTAGEKAGGWDTDRSESSIQKAPPSSAVKRWRQPTSPTGRSDLSTSTYGSDVSDATSFCNGEKKPHTLAGRAAVVAVGIPSSTSRPGSIFVSRAGATSVNGPEGARTPTNRPEATPEEEAIGAPKAAHSNPPDNTTPGGVSSARNLSDVGSMRDDNNARRDSNGEPPSMPPLPPNVNQLARKEVERGSRSAARVINANAGAVSAGCDDSGLKEEHQVEEIRSGVVLTSPSRRATPLGGVLSNFACLAGDDEESPSAAEASGAWRGGEKLTAHSPRTIPRSRAPCSRLPRVADDDGDLDEVPLVRGELETAATSALPSAGDNDGSAGEGSISATGHHALDKVLTIFRGHVITSELQPVLEGEDEDRVVTDSETESEISSRASSFSGVEGSRRASRDSALSRARQIAAIPPPSSGSAGLFVTPLEAVAEVPGEVKERDSPHLPPYPDRPKSSRALVIPSPSVRPTTIERMTNGNGDAEETDETVKTRVAAGPVVNNPPMMDDGASGTQVEDLVKGEKSVVAGDVPDAEMSTQKWAPQPPLPLSLPTPAKRPTEQLSDAEQSPRFSLISALSTFLWKKEKASRGSTGDATLIPGEHGVDFVAHGYDGVGADDRRRVSPSQSLKDWAESKVEAPPKHALDGGSSEASMDTAVERKGEGRNIYQVTDGQPSRGGYSDLPSLALDDGKRFWIGRCL